LAQKFPRQARAQPCRHGKSEPIEGSVGIHVAVEATPILVNVSSGPVVLVVEQP
jgi:hypothetical protein